MQQYLITSKEVSALARDMSMHMDEERVNTYIRESEMIDLKPRLGDSVYLDIKEHPEKYTELLDGCTYEVDGEKKIIAGLKTALAYYAYARLVKDGTGNVTRFGYVNKESEYSSNAEFKQRMMQYDSAFVIADNYLRECLIYLDETKNELYKGRGKMKSNRTMYKIIGE